MVDVFASSVHFSNVLICLIKSHLVAALFRICSLIVWILFTVYFPVLVLKLLPVGNRLIDVISSITLLLLVFFFLLLLFFPHMFKLFHNFSTQYSSLG